eukprot:362046_1
MSPFLSPFLSKSILFPIIFCISPLLLLNILLLIFIFGNSPKLYFTPNMQTFHSFYLYINHTLIPSLKHKLNCNFNNKIHISNEWIEQFVYLLFNCAILNEYITKIKHSTKHSQRVSFVNFLAG